MKIKKANTVLPLFVLLALVISFYGFFNAIFDKTYKEQINTAKKEISLKTLRNCILLLNFYEPVECYLDYPVSSLEFKKWSNLNVNFCYEYENIKGRIFVYYDENKKCVFIKK